MCGLGARQLRACRLRRRPGGRSPRSVPPRAPVERNVARRDCRTDEQRRFDRCSLLARPTGWPGNWRRSSTRGHLGKTIFVFPRLAPSELVRRWTHTSKVLRAAGASSASCRPRPESSTPCRSARRCRTCDVCRQPGRGDLSRVGRSDTRERPADHGSRRSPERVRDVTGCRRPGVNPASSARLRSSACVVRSPTAHSPRRCGSAPSASGSTFRWKPTRRRAIGSSASRLPSSSRSPRGASRGSPVHAARWSTPAGGNACSMIPTGRIRFPPLRAHVDAVPRAGRAPCLLSPDCSDSARSASSHTACWRSAITSHGTRATGRTSRGR